MIAGEYTHSSNKTLNSKKLASDVVHVTQVLFAAAAGPLSPIPAHQPRISSPLYQSVTTTTTLNDDLFPEETYPTTLLKVETDEDVKPHNENNILDVGDTLGTGKHTSLTKFYNSLVTSMRLSSPTFKKNSPISPLPAPTFLQLVTTRQAL
jgi:hypothetical protein